MPIVIQCAGCSSTYKVDDNLAGKKVKCRKCSAIIPVPDPTLESEPLLEAEPVLVEDSAAETPALAPRTCPSCGATARASAVMCLTCGYNFRTGSGAGAPAIELADAPQVVKKRSRFNRAPGQKLYSSIDSLIFMITFWLFLASLVVWGIHVVSQAGAFSFGLIAPALVVMALILIIVVPAMAIAITATCNTMQYPPRHDNYIRAATALAFPFAISLICSGSSGDNPGLGLLITASWLLMPVLFGYLFRAEITEWVATLIAGGVALMITWFLVGLAAPYLPTLAGPLYTDRMPDGPWMKLATSGHSPAPQTAPPAVPNAPEIASIPPQNNPPPVIPSPAETKPPIAPTPAPAPAQRRTVIVPIAPALVPAPATTTVTPAPTVVTQAEGLAEITADPDLQNLRQAVVSDITAQYFLAVKDSGEGEAVVERWSADPLAKKGELSFQELPKEPNDYAINPAGTVLVSLSHFPKNQLQISNFDKPGAGKKIPLDHLQMVGTPKLIGFIDAGHFIVRWNGGGGTLQVWSSDGVISSFSKSEAMGDNLDKWAISPNPGRIGAKLAAILPGPGGFPQIMVGRIDGWSLVSQFTPLSVSYQEAGLAFSPDANSIGICALTSDGGTVLTFDVKSGDNKQTIIFPAAVFAASGKHKRVAHGLVWMGNNQLLLVGGNSLYDSVSGKKIGSLGLENIVDAHNIGPNSLLLVQEGENGAKNALVAKINASLLDTARLDDKK